jgi:hypothetical protein
VRDDVGGHFGVTAARFAVETLPELATGRIEMSRTVRGREPRLYFAGELVATAMLRHLPGKNAGEKVKRFLEDHLIVAGRHATNCVHVLTVCYLFGRFGK